MSLVTFFHWLPLHACIQHKLHVSTFKAIHGLVPPYPSSHISHHVAACCLQSSSNTSFYSPKGSILLGNYAVSLELPHMLGTASPMCTQCRLNFLLHILLKMTISKLPLAMWTFAWLPTYSGFFSLPSLCCLPLLNLRLQDLCCRDLASILFSIMHHAHWWCYIN